MGWDDDNNNDDPFGIKDMFEDIRKNHNAMDDEFRKLAIEPTMVIPEVGDTVIIAAGLLGMGHVWVRKEGVVLMAGDTSYKVEFVDEKDYVTGENKVKWVVQTLITDVIRKKK